MLVFFFPSWRVWYIRLTICSEFGGTICPKIYMTDSIHVVIMMKDNNAFLFISLPSFYCNDRKHVANMASDFNTLKRVPDCHRDLVSGSVLLKANNHKQYYNIQRLSIFLTISYYAVIECFDIIESNKIADTTCCLINVDNT